MSDASFYRAAGRIRKVAAAAVGSYEVQQLAGGMAGVFDSGSAADSGDTTEWVTEGSYALTKTAGIVLLAGGRAYWDHSANAITFRKVNDRDFYVGRVVSGAASADVTVVVNLNVDPRDDVDLLRDAVLSVPVGTQAVGGFGFAKRLGGSDSLELTATSEAQKIDLLSVDRFDKAANAVIEIIVRPVANGSGSDVDCNLGIANGTHATDAESITEAVFFHIDGGSTTINAQSKDGTTTVAATDTTTTITAGSAVASRKELWIDTSDPASVKLYVDGVRVNSGNTFRIDNATGPFGLLAHLEKTTGTQTANFVIDAFRARYAEQ